MRILDWECSQERTHAPPSTLSPFLVALAANASRAKDQMEVRGGVRPPRAEGARGVRKAGARLNAGGGGTHLRPSCPMQEASNRQQRDEDGYSNAFVGKGSHCLVFLCFAGSNTKSNPDCIVLLSISSHLF